MTCRQQINGARRFVLTEDRTGIVDCATQEHIATCNNEAIATRIAFLLNLETAGEVPSAKEQVS
jgi:hypothetical protein